MKKALLILPVAATMLFVGCNSDSDVVSQKNLGNTQDSFSYAIGAEIGASLADLNGEISINALAQGIFDQYSGAELQVSAEDAQALKETVFKRLVEKKEEERAASDPAFAQALAERKAAEESAVANAEGNKAAGVQFLADNASKEGVVTTESGLQYKVITKGSGEIPTSASTVEVNYEGTLIDGTVFDSSYKNGKSVSFPVTGVIKGWTEVLQLMPVGSTYMVYLPSELAYGEQQAGPAIAPGSTLIFKIELIASK